MSKKKSLLANLLIILIISFIFCTYPYVFQRLIGIQNEKAIIVSAFFIFLVLLQIERRSRSSTIPTFIKGCMIVQFIVWCIYSGIHADISYIVRCFLIVLSYIMISILCKKNILVKFFSVYNAIIAIQVFLGAIAFVLIFVGVLKPLLAFENIDGRPAYFYGLTCSNFVLDNVVRIAGFFDEPGALAYWGIFALLFNKLFLDKKNLEYIIIVGLFFTLSAGYFVQISLYFLLFYLTSLRRRVVPLFLIAACLYIGYNKVSDNDVIAKYTIERFEGGEIHTSRTELSKIAKKEFLKNPIIGNGATNIENIAYMGDNPYEILAKDGVIGLFITYLPLLMCCFKYGKKKEVLFACVILAAGYLQRPLHVNILHYFMLYSFVTLVYLKYRNYYSSKVLITSNI